MYNSICFRVSHFLSGRRTEYGLLGHISLSSKNKNDILTVKNVDECNECERTMALPSRKKRGRGDQDEDGDTEMSLNPDIE